MLREAAKELIPPEKHFRWRGGEITRLEGFTDAVFALAVLSDALLSARRVSLDVRRRVPGSAPLERSPSRAAEVPWWKACVRPALSPTAQLPVPLPAIRTPDPGY